MKYFADRDVSLDLYRRRGRQYHHRRQGGVRAGRPGPMALGQRVTITRLGLEASPLSPWLHTGLRAAGLPAICIETRRMKGATAAMAVKTDRNNPRAIAHAMRVGWFTTVHVKTAESQELRLLLNNRRTLSEERVAIDNELRGTQRPSASRSVRSASSASRRG
jgi:transposase